MPDNQSSEPVATDNGMKDKATDENAYLSNSLPGRDEGEALLILPDGGLRKVIRCQGVNSSLFDRTTLQKLAREFSALAASLEVEIQIIATTAKVRGEKFLEDYRLTVKNDSEFINSYSELTERWFTEICNNQDIQQRAFYVIVSYQPGAGAAFKHDKHVKHVKHVKHEWNGSEIDLPEGSLKELERQTQKICQSLTRCNLKPTRLIRRDLRKLLKEHHCLELLAVEPPTSLNAHSTSVPEIVSEHVRIDNKYIGVQYLQTLPEEIWIGWLNGLLTLGIEQTLSLFLRPVKKAIPQSELKMPLIVERKEDPSSSTTNLDRLSNPPQITTVPTTFLEVGLCIRTEAESLPALIQQQHKIEKLFSSLGSIVVKDKLDPLKSWQSSLPIATDELAAINVIDARVAGTFWPFFSAHCGTPDGILFGLTPPDSNEPVMLNPFFRNSGKENNNFLIAGALTAGQSFVTMMLILRLLPLGVRVILLSDNVDRFSSYHFLTELLGPDASEKISLSDGSGHVINPFDLGANEIHCRPSGDKVRSLLSFFDLILAPEGHDELTIQEKALLDKLIQKAYKKAESRDTLPTISDFTRLVELSASEETDAVKRGLLQNLAGGLSIYTKPGAYSSFLDGQTNIGSSNKQLVVCETKNINGHRYRNAVTYALTHYLENEAQIAKMVGRRLAVLVHQSDGVMISEQGLHMIDSISSRTRQSGMMFGVVTNQLRTLCSNAPSFVRNAHSKIFLRQDPGELALLKEQLRLTNEQLESIDNFSATSESLICMLNIGDTSGVARLILSPLDYWIFTAEPIMDIPKRMSKIAAIKSANPEITHSEACRLAVSSLSHE